MSKSSPTPASTPTARTALTRTACGYWKTVALPYAGPCCPAAVITTVRFYHKELLTDKSEFFGGTNFSKKGLRENWEHSGVVHFDAGDNNSLAERDDAKPLRGSPGTTSLRVQLRQTGRPVEENYTGPDKDFKIEDARFGAIRKVLKGVEKFEEEESGAWAEKQLEQPEIKTHMAQMIASGIDDSVPPTAVRKHMGGRDYFKTLQGFESYGELKRLAPRN